MTEDRLAGLAGADVRASAFRRLADEHLDASYRLAYSILHSAPDAQDATHDAFVTAWRRWSSLRDPDRFQAWFDRILVNTCRHRMRDAARHRTEDLSPALSAAIPGLEDRVEAQDLLSDAVRSLGTEHRIVIALRYSRDLTVDQIAAWLGIRSGTVKSRLHYALHRLHDSIEAHDLEEGSR